VSDAALKAQMPVMLLQPLLENAIFHGPSSMERQLRIEVSAEIADEGRTLRIVVADDGKGIDAAKVKELNDPAADGEESIGVRNVRERIRLRYGAAYGLTIDSAPGEGTKAILLLPYQPRGENADVEHAGR